MFTFSYSSLLYVLSSAFSQSLVIITASFPIFLLFPNFVQMSRFQTHPNRGDKYNTWGHSRNHRQTRVCRPPITYTNSSCCLLLYVLSKCTKILPVIPEVIYYPLQVWGNNDKKVWKVSQVWDSHSKNCIRQKLINSSTVNRVKGRKKITERKVVEIINQLRNITDFGNPICPNSLFSYIQKIIFLHLLTTSGC